MKTILLATKNKELIDNVNNITTSKYSIVCLDDLKHLQNYTEEFMPSYLIMSSDLEDFKNAVQYINNNTNCELIVTGTGGSDTTRGNLFINDFNTIEDLDKILRIIDNMENEKGVDDSREIKFINQQVISFFSVQGGSGKTSMAFNFAWYLKNLKNIKILLIDLNFAQGPSDLTVCLNLPVIPNLSLFIEKISQGYEALAESIVRLGSLNIDILQPPLTLHQSDNFNVDMLDSLIYLGRNNYNFIIADIPFRFDNICIEMLNLSTISLLVLNPNSGTIIRANEFNRLLPQYQEKGIVVNNVTREQAYSIKDLKALLDTPIFMQIPHICEKEICYLKYGKRNLKIVDLQSKILNLASQII